MENNENKKKCCFCGKEIVGWGNNPWPANTDENAECCDDCNLAVVLPERLLGFLSRKESK